MSRRMVSIETLSLVTEPNVGALHLGRVACGEGCQIQAAWEVLVVQGTDPRVITVLVRTVVVHALCPVAVVNHYRTTLCCSVNAHGSW